MNDESATIVDTLSLLYYATSVAVIIYVYREPITALVAEVRSWAKQRTHTVSVEGLRGQLWDDVRAVLKDA